MLYEIFRYSMGTVVQFLSDLYSRYGSYINFVVMIYGISILWSHQNLRQIMKKVEVGIVKTAEEEGQPYNYKKIYNRFAQKWQNKTKGTTAFIPSKRDIWFNRVEQDNIIDLLNINADYVKMALHKNTGIPPTQDFREHEFIAWEEYRHSLVRGLRKRFIEPKEIKERLKKKRA